MEQYLLDNLGVLIEHLLTGCSEFNPTEACWHVIKITVDKSTHCDTVRHMRDAMPEFMWTYRFTSIVVNKNFFRKPFEIQYFSS